MTTETSLQPISSSGNSSAQKKERSRSYPAYTLEDSLDLCIRIFKSFGSTNFTSREDIATALTISLGHIQQQVATAVQYGLLDLESKTGDYVSVAANNWQNAGRG